MADKQIPDDVRRFIVSNIPSVPYLEAILLLRNDPADAWDNAKLAHRLYIPEKNAAAILSDLIAADIVEKSGGMPLSCRYAPSTERLRDTIDQVAESYAAHLVDITNLIHSKNSKKAHQFANAFKWRED